MLEGVSADGRYLTCGWWNATVVDDVLDLLTVEV